MKILIEKWKECQRELEEINQELETISEGYLSKRKKCYYQTIGRKDFGITKKPKIIRSLCRKAYLLARKEQLIHNMTLAPNAVKKFDDRTPKELIAALSTAYQEVPISYFYHPSIEPWLAEPYEKHPYPPEEGYTTKNGVRVRTKSEFFIATQLENYQIPYRYEEALMMRGKKEYPDFTIKNPFTGKTIIWEHFGALHLSDYEKRMNDKMESYLMRGYVQNDTIIYTFEFQVKKDNRLQKIIEEFIL